MIRKFKYGDKDAILSILNYFVHNSFAAYPDEDFTLEQMKFIFEMPGLYPFYVIEIDDKVIGFGLLHPYLKMSTFSHTAEITYFILPEFTSKGFGGKLLDHILSEAKNKGFEVILASISSLNPASLNFHRKYGFKECGRFKKIGKKFKKNFDVIWMQKFI